MRTNCKVTLYRFIDGVYTKGLYSAWWQDTKIATFQKTGLTNCDTATVYIPQSDVALGFSLGKDYIVQGECELGLDNTNQKLLSESLAKLVKQGALTITAVENKLYGAKNMQHYKLSCK